MMIVVNPAAGGGRAEREWARLSPRLRAAGLKFEERMTSRPGEATEIALDAAVAGCPLLVAAGGDGTLYELANGVLASGTDELPCLAALPLGTGMDVGRSFGIPSDPLLAAGLLTGGRRRRIDAGRITCAGPDGPRQTYFLNVADAGIGADVADLVNGGFRVLNGAVTFSLAAFVILMRWRNPRLRIRIDAEEEMERTCQQLVVANCQYYGGGMRIAPGASPDDGMFDVVINGDLGVLETVRLLGKVRNGSHMAHPKIELRRARRVEVTSERGVGIDADGERPGALPAVFEIVPGAVELMVPAQANLSRSST